MIKAHSDNANRGTHEAVAKLKFAANPFLAERINAFYNQSARVNVGKKTLLLYSLKSIPCQISTAAHDSGRIMPSVKNYQLVSAAEQRLARRQDAPLSLENSGEFKMLGDDVGLDMRLRVIVDRLTEMALGEELARQFVDSGSVQVNIPVLRHSLKSGPALVDAHARMVEALSDNKPPRMAVALRGIETNPRGMAERVR